MTPPGTETAGAAASAPAFGATVRIEPGDRGRVARVLAAMGRLGWKRLRIDVDDAAGDGWLDWLLARLTTDVTVIPVLRCEPGRTDGFAASIDGFAVRHAAALRWIELRVGSTAAPARSALADATRAARARGLKVAVSGLPWKDRDLMAELVRSDMLADVDALAVDVGADAPTAETLAELRKAANGRPGEPETWALADGAALSPAAAALVLARLSAAGTDGVFWGPLLADDGVTGGLFGKDDTPALAARLTEKGGTERLGELAARRRPPARGAKPVVITGGAGFIGTNLAHRLAGLGQPVLVFDSLARPGVEDNLAWLSDRHGSDVGIEIADLSDRQALREAVRSAGAVVHLAAQVAVTTSVVDPEQDFAVNARGTLALLEELRALPNPVPLIYTSTNKVYGKLADIQMRQGPSGYVPVDPQVAASGIGEEQPLDFYSPYGCSKGAADQYVVDYARIYRLPAVVFRMSCIYGPHQYGTEDQGWVAHFLIRALEGEPITLYGDGRQVRDILHVNDLIDAFLLGLRHIGGLAGQAYNIGGGRANAVSLLDLLELIGRLNGTRPEIDYGPWRPGDQPWYVSNTAKFRAITGWKPQVGVEDGVTDLLRWLRLHRFGNRHQVASGALDRTPTAGLAP